MKDIITEQFYQAFEKRNLVEKYIDENGNEQIRIKDPTGEGYVEHCPMHMPKAYAENPLQKRNFKKKNVNPEEKLKAYADQCHRGKITNPCLCKTVELWKNGLSVFFVSTFGEIKVIEANANGTRRKAIADRNKIAEHARRACKLYPFTLFLTLTQRVEPGKTDIIWQYQFFGEHLSKFLADLCKKFYCVYEVISEATNNGYRHAHIVLHFKRMPDVNRIVKRKFHSDVYGGKLREWIKAHWTLGTSKLELSEKRNPITYLLKYITKFAYTDIEKMGKKGNDLSADERKGLMTLLNPIISRTRRYNLSRFTKEELAQTDALIEKERAQNCTKLQVVRAHYKPAKPCKISILRPRRSLDRPCINSESPCKTFIRALNYITFKKRSFGGVEDFKDLPEEFQKKLFNSATPITCQGCLFTHYRNEILTHKDSWFHKDECNESPLQVAEGSDYWLYTDEEVEKREVLLKKYDERVLPLVADNLRLTIYKKIPTPPVKITFAKKMFVPSMEQGKYEDAYKGSYAVKIHKYLLNPKSNKDIFGRRLEYTEDMVVRPTAKVFYKNEIEKEDYEKYEQRQRNKLLGIK